VAHQTSLSQERAGPQHCQDGLFSVSRYDSNFDLAGLDKIKALCGLYEPSGSELGLVRMEHQQECAKGLAL